MLYVRAFLALLAGFATMAVLVGVVTAVLVKRFPKWVGAQGHPRPTYVLVNLAWSFLASMAGGCVTAWVSSNDPLRQTLVLAIIVLLLSGLSALQLRGRQPIWYQLLLIVLSPLGVLAGGLIRLQILGR
jgi:hypothetical protein